MLSFWAIFSIQFSVTIHVTLPNSFRRHVELLSDLLDPVLYDHESLGTAEATEGSVRRQVGFAAVTLHSQMWHLQ
jgi:hypothetical protein